MFPKLTRVSPAMVVALVALMFSVGGTSFAQGAASKLGKLVSGSKIKRASIPGNRLVKGGVTGDRIRSNSLTGKQINERTLATVPSALTAKRVAVADRATNAQRATNADNALALGGTAAAGYLAFASRPIPSGTTVSGAFGISNATTVTLDPPATTSMANDLRQVVQLPGTAPADLGDGSVNVSVVPGAADADPTCQGIGDRPDGARGQGLPLPHGDAGRQHDRRGRGDPAAPGQPRRLRRARRRARRSGSTGAFGTWAYTAP